MKKLVKKVRLILTFYGSYCFFSGLMTAICLAIFWEYGYGIFAALFWLKLFSLSMAYIVINSYKRKEFYYYRNLGLSKRLLWVSTLSFDMVFYLVLVFLIPHR